MPEAGEILFVGGSRLAALHEAALPQKDECCGPFWGMLGLRALGIDEVDGEPVDQDLVAREAGTTLSHEDPYVSLPPGEEPRVDYRLRLPAAEAAAEAGTNAPPVARAVERLSQGRLAVVRVAGPWRPQTVVALLELCLEQAPDAVLVANVATRHLAGTHPAQATLVAHLEGEPAEWPPSEWDVGHFVGLGFLLRGRGGSLVGVRDTYRSLGWNGVHLQPPAAVAEALARDGGAEGGVLCICRAADASRLTEVLVAEGFELRDWDNGSVPAPGTPA